MTIGLIAGLGEFQRADQQRQIVPVDRPEIAHAHLLERSGCCRSRRGRPTPARWRVCSQADLGDRALEAFLGLVRQLQGQFALGQAAEQPFEIPRQPVVATDG